jgi:hypothetical protein
LKESSLLNLYAALIHYPVKDKNGEIIASAVTNLDLHDIARAAKTYGLRSFYVVTPLEDQQELVQRIIAHWITGGGSKYNPTRGLALELIEVKSTLEQVAADITRSAGSAPKMVVTSARNAAGNLSYGRLKAMLATGSPYLLLFGTAWGLAEEFIQAADYRLDPLLGPTDYNHLSVRCAAAVIFDRLLGR